MIVQVAQFPDYGHIVAGIFDIENGSNHYLSCYLFTYRIKHCVISVFNVLVLYGLSRSHKLHKQMSAEY